MHHSAKYESEVGRGVRWRYWCILLLLLMLTASARDDLGMDPEKTTLPGIGKDDGRRGARAMRIIDQSDQLQTMDRDGLYELLQEQLQENSEFLKRDPVLKRFIDDQLEQVRTAREETGIPLAQDAELMEQLRRSFGDRVTPQQVLTYGQLQELANRYRAAGKWQPELQLYYRMRELFENDPMQYFMMTDQIVRILLAHRQESDALREAIGFYLRYIERLQEMRHSFLLLDRIARQALEVDDWPRAFQAYRTGLYIRSLVAPLRQVYGTLMALSRQHSLPPMPDAAADHWYAERSEQWQSVKPLVYDRATQQAISRMLAEEKRSAVVRERLLILNGDWVAAAETTANSWDPEGSTWGRAAAILILAGGDPRIFDMDYKAAAPLFTSRLRGLMAGDRERLSQEYANWIAIFRKDAQRVQNDRSGDLTLQINARLNEKRWAQALESLEDLQKTAASGNFEIPLILGRTITAWVWHCRWQLRVQESPGSVLPGQESGRWFHGFVEHNPQDHVGDFLAASGYPEPSLEVLEGLQRELADKLRALDQAAFGNLRLAAAIAAGDLATARQILDAGEGGGADLPNPVLKRRRQLQERFSWRQQLRQIAEASAEKGLIETHQRLVQYKELTAHRVKEAALSEDAFLSMLVSEYERLLGAEQSRSAAILAAAAGGAGLLPHLQAIELFENASGTIHVDQLLPLVAPLFTAAYPEISQGIAGVLLDRTSGANATEKAGTLLSWFKENQQPAITFNLAEAVLRTLSERREYVPAIDLSRDIEEHFPDQADRILLFRAMCLLRMNANRDAVDELQGFLKASPNSAESVRAQFLLAIGLLKLERRDDAVQLLRRLFHEHPENPYSIQAGRLLKQLEGDSRN